LARDPEPAPRRINHNRAPLRAVGNGPAADGETRRTVMIGAAVAVEWELGVA
jgi:hypothetical protein